MIAAARKKGFTIGLVVTCKRCGAGFTKIERGGRLPGYCSEQCRKAEKLSRDQQIKPRLGRRSFTCEYCQRVFESNIRMQFCSRTCRARKEIAAKPFAKCKACDGPIIRTIGRGNDRLYCSLACRPKRRDAGHGYIGVYVPGHPTVMKSGWQYEHRVVLYDAIGPGEHPCHHCGKMVAWDTHYNAPGGLGVDHLDRNRKNNAIENLVPSCRTCNNRRRLHRHAYKAIVVSHYAST